MPLGVVCAAPHPPAKTTTLAHANGLNPSVTNILTFLGKESDYSAQFGVLMLEYLKSFETCQLGNLRISPLSSRRACGDCK